MNSFYSEDELKDIGFKEIGKNIQISKKASIYSANEISIGNNVRIDDFCILSGKIQIENYIHIAAYTALYGGKYGIKLEQFCNISSRCVIYALGDDYYGEAMTNPTIPDKYRKVTGKKVILSKHVIVGTGSTILPGVCIGEGSSVGCMSLVNNSLNSWGVFAGVPCKQIGKRSKNLIKKELEFINSDEYLKR